MRYASNIQLNYLLTKFKINTANLIKEMDEYYSDEHWFKMTTKRGKVTAVQLRPGHKPLLKRPQKTSSAPKQSVGPSYKSRIHEATQSPKPTVHIKRRRHIKLEVVK